MTASILCRFPSEGVVLKPLILFVRSDGLGIHGISVGRRPTGDAGVRVETSVATTMVMSKGLVAARSC
jgi:hypothetical protein